MGNPGPDIFTPIDDDVAPPQIERRSAHPVPRTGICGWPGPLDTNKFYANFFLGSQTQATWVHPYSLQWSKGQGNTGSWGMSISHVEAHQLGLAPGDPPVQYYINALGIQSMILSAAELGPATQLTTHEHDAFSVRVDLAPRPNAPALLWIPCVQGMGFVTGVYDNATPVLGSSVLFRSISPAIRNGRAMKYRVVTEDNCNWLIYVTPHSPYDTTEFHMQSNSAIVAPPGFQGIIQVAKNPTGRKGEKIYDLAAGSYATSVTINGRTKAYEHHVGGTYTLEWEKAGSGPLLMYALPHHVHSFDDATAATKTGLELRTTTKGMATAILGDRMTMVEPCLPTTMGFAPWSPTLGERTTLSKQARDAVNEAATHELGANMTDQCNLNSMYFSGKGLAKFATLVYVASELARNAQLAASGLARLKTEFARFVANAQQTPLVYDEAWRGVVSTAGYADAGADFGNSYYNDHHFHYGYFVYTAAVIAFVDPAWLHQGTNKAWVQMLVKDYANADPQLQHGGAYPFSRAFDWWHGHSWAKGLFESADGKDEESTSEDGFSAYAIKMWGRVIGDANMEARGNLMLAIQARVFNAYFYLSPLNPNHPPQILGNKVTGILFENKVDYATYFSPRRECIHGIHALPLSPALTLLRRPAFVADEWRAFFSDGRVHAAEGGWRGVLMANLALADPAASFRFWAHGVDGRWDWSWVDGGASRAWAIAFAAALGGG